MAFTDFFVIPTGDASPGNDTFAGSTNSGTPTVAVQTNGDWNNATANTYTAASGTPFSGVTAGMWASVFLDGSTSTGFVARVTAVNGGGASITLSTTAIMGAAPAAGATGRSCVVGGAWKTIGQAKALASGAATDAAGDLPSYNIKNSGTHSLAGTLTFANNGPYVVQGYTTSARDLGRATIDLGGGTFNGVVISGNIVLARDLILQNGGTGGGGGDGIELTGIRSALERVTVHDVGANGIYLGGSCAAIECEAYNCNKANNGSSRAGINLASNAYALRCISHDNLGTGTPGFIVNNASTSVLEDCIADRNPGPGVSVTTAGDVLISGCDLFNNTGDGITVSATQGFIRIENTNAVLNGGVGIHVTTTGTLTYAVNPGFYNNTGGQTTGSTTALVVEGAITYTGSPYNNASAAARPSGGDFTITLAAAQGAGRGAFQQASAIYNATSAGFPDIGAVQHAAGGGGSGGVGSLVDGGLVR